MIILTENFKLIGLMMGLYLISYIINTLLGVYHNINVLKEMFDKNKLIEGGIKAGIILITSLLLTLSVSILPLAINELGIEVSQETLNGISITTICVVMVTAILKYLKDALKKFYEILGCGKTDTNNEEKTDT